MKEPASLQLSSKNLRISRGRYRGTMKHSGAELDAPFCHVYRFDADRIVSFHQYTDSAQWARLMP